MGRRSSEKPTIRILILGAPGVGKDCLESRFTTMQYPPQYDTNLVNSRRFLHLSPRPTALPPSPPTTTSTPIQRPRPSSTSTTFSNPGSLPSPIIPIHQTLPPPHPNQGHPKLTLNTALPSPNPSNNNKNDWFTPSPTPTTPNPGGSPSHTTNTTSTSENRSRNTNTYLIEIQNSPHLHHPPSRTALLSRGSFDAVLLVYDVCSRASFDAAARLYNEVPARALRRGGGGSPGGDGPGGAGETVICLVGNKTDVDLDAGGDGSVGVFRGEMFSPKQAEREGREVAARGLVHPLFRGRFPPHSPVTKPAPPTPPTPEPTSTIDKWIAVDAEADVTDTDDDEHTRVGSRESLKPARREVSRQEGEMLARSLLLNVPFFETSAKTGEGVDAMFEAVVREALWQMGRGVEEGPGVVVLGKKGSVLKKGRGEVRRSVVGEGVLASPISELPPVLRLPDFGGFETGPDVRLREMVTVENPVVVAAPVLKRRRDSVLGGFFKKIFRRSVVTG